MSVTLRHVQSPDAWTEITGAFLDFNYRQTWACAEVSARWSGAEAEFVVIERDGMPIAAAAVRVRTLPVVGGGLAYVAGGPLCRPTGGEADPSTALAALADHYTGARGLTLRVMGALGSERENQVLRDALGAPGWAPAPWPRPYQTLAVDTTLDDDALRDSFSKNWRKKLRRGETRGLTSRLGTTDDDLAAVVRLHHELIERKGFNTDVDAAMLREVQRELPDEQKLVAILIEADGEVAGMNLVSPLGDTLMGLIGATTTEGAERGGAYLLEYLAMNLARERGQVRYDMGGYDPTGNEGVANFKMGTRGEILVAAGPAERHASGLRPGLARLGERLYRAVRRPRSVVSAAE